MRYEAARAEEVRNEAAHAETARDDRAVGQDHAAAQEDRAAEQEGRAAGREGQDRGGRPRRRRGGTASPVVEPGPPASNETAAEHGNIGIGVTSIKIGIHLLK